LIKVFQAAFVKTKFSFPKISGLQKALGFQLLTTKVEGKEHLALDL
jgi:hypothetical protein